MNRKDGIKVKNLDEMHGLINFVMPRRADSEVYINTKLDVTNLVEYINKKKKQKGNEDLTYFHAFAIGIGKLLYNRPLLNRFIINKTHYDRKDITLSFVAKKEFNDLAEETFNVVKVEEKDNIFTMSNKISGKVHKVREEKKTNAADNFINNIGKLPKFIRWLIIKIVKFADNHDLIPQSLTSNSIYHSSVLLSNLGSIKCGAIYHHLTDLGTNSLLITIGEIKDEPVVIDGKVEIRKMCEFGATLDERIGDGFYFVKSLKLLEYMFNNPEVLEEDANVRIIEKQAK